MDDTKEDWKGSRHAPYKFTPDKRKAYLELLAKGVRRGAAAEAIGFTRYGVTEYLKRYPEFQKEIDQAEMHEVELVEGFLFEACRKGNAAAIFFHLQNRAPDKWVDKRVPKIIIKQDSIPEDLKSKLEGILKPADE
jgi:hypothetical protein